MKNITKQFDEVYIPRKALLLYEYNPSKSTGANSKIYVESYDIGKTGRPINAHPLTIKEMILLNRVLQSTRECQTHYFNSSGLLPSHVLHIDNTEMGSIIWYSPAQAMNLFFSPALGIPNGKACVPAMIWKANRENLFVYALKSNKKPDVNTKLFHAPFFNVYQNGKVCMGTVELSCKDSCLEDFITSWEHSFWNSYFSHLMEGFTPVKGNIVLLWKHLIQTGENFSLSALQSNGQSLKNLLP